MTVKRIMLWGSLLLASSGLALFAGLSLTEKEAAAATDPRLQDPVVLLATTVPMAGRDRSFTGVIAARVESGLGFRVGGKITARLVSTGEVVRAGQPLMRIDDTDLQLALAAKRNAVEAARASVSQLAPDEQRYASLLDRGWIARQRYEQARAALDAARAQLSSAEADARVASNQTAYAELVADADGTVVETLGEPGQVVAAGQAVLRIARAGPREALVTLPEGMRPEIGSLATASVYGEGDDRYAARLRELSDAADPQTRTYEARYVLEGAAATAPLGATVTIRFNEGSDGSAVEVPIGALRDTGNRVGLWELDTAKETVHFRDVRLISLGDETAVISGPEAGTPIVALGAQLLEEGQRVRAQPAKGDAR